MFWDDLDLWLAATPLMVIGLAMLAAMALAIFAGVALRRFTDHRDAIHGAPAAEGLEGIMVSAILALMALLMAFTYSIVLSRFEDRRALVLDEANAIGTVYLRAQLLEQPHRERIGRLLIDYTDVRIELAQAAPNPTRNADLLARNDGLVTALWAATVAAYPTIHDPGLSGQFLQAMNALIDLDTSRKMARLVRVPAEVFLVVFVFLVATANILGYLLVGRRGRAVLALMVILLTVTLLMILDVDRPTDGGVREDQRPLVAVKASLASTPPGAYDQYVIEDAKGVGTAKP